MCIIICDDNKRSWSRLLVIVIATKMPSTWDWPEFQRDIHALVHRSQSLNDTWHIVPVPTAEPTEECSEYLRKTTKLFVHLPATTPQYQFTEERFPADEDADDDPSAVRASNASPQTLLAYDFHVLFHPSYRVPALYYNATKPDGSQLSLDEAWQMMRISSTDDRHSPKLTNVLTEMHHPVLGTAFLALHPCRTGELLAALPDSANRVLTFVSTLGAAVNLQMDVRYGLMERTE